MEPKIFYADDKLIDPTKPCGVKVTVTLSELQVHVLKHQAKCEHRTFDQMLQIVLYEGWGFYLEDHYVYIPHREPDVGEVTGRTHYSDGETRDLMVPMVPTFDTLTNYIDPED